MTDDRIRRIAEGLVANDPEAEVEQADLSLNEKRALNTELLRIETEGTKAQEEQVRRIRTMREGLERELRGGDLGDDDDE
jgi:hypothetical protein